MLYRSKMLGYMSAYFISEHPHRDVGVPVWMPEICAKGKHTILNNLFQNLIVPLTASRSALRGRFHSEATERRYSVLNMQEKNFSLFLAHFKT